MIYRPRLVMQLTMPSEVVPGAASLTSAASSAAGGFAGIAAAAVTDLAISGATTVSFPVRVQSASLKVNDHNKADELHVVCDWNDAGIDPRIISGGVGALFVDDADDFGVWAPSEDNVRFVGRVSKAKRHGGEGKASSVELSMVDFTSYFLLAKPFASKGIPLLSQTVAGAWHTIISGFDNGDGQNPVAGLAEAIEFRGLAAPGPVLGEATAKRFARAGGRVHVDPKIDAWAVWQQCCGMCGLISYFERDTLVVTTALDYYSGDRPALLRLGLNVLDFNEERNNDFERKGVGVTSFDPLTGRTLEAIYPPVGDSRIKHPIVKPNGKKKAKPKTEAQVASKEHRDYFQFSGITDQAALDRLAARVWAERSIQEMQGTVTTAEMRIQQQWSGLDTDILSLHSGDTIVIQLDEVDWAGADILSSMPSVGARKEYFMSLGYADGVAGLMAANLDSLTKLRRDFYVKGYDMEFSTSEEGGDFKVTVHYCNKIEIGGDTSKAPS